MGAQPQLSRRMTAIKNTMIWMKLSEKERDKVMSDVESGKDLGNLRKNTRAIIVKAETEIQKEREQRLARMIQ